MRLAALLLLCLIAGCDRLESMIALGEPCRRTERLDEALVPAPIEWSLAPDSVDRRVLELWCETVGPIVFDPSPAIADTGNIYIDSLAIISWNTHVGGADIVRFVHNLRAGRFTNGDSVHHFVLLLQEVYRSSDSVPARVRIGVPGRIAVEPPGRIGRTDIVAAAATLGLSLLYVPSMRNGPPAPGLAAEDRGNAILSTLELEDAGAIELPHEVQRRVAAVAEVEAETKEGKHWDLTLVSTHLDTRSRLGRLQASFGIGRHRQATALIDALDHEQMVVVGGDFNTWAPEFLERAVPHLRSAFPATPTTPVEPTFVARGIRRRLDYLFFRLPEGWRAAYTRIDAQYGSDHYPLLGWVYHR